MPIGTQDNVTDYKGSHPTISWDANAQTDDMRLTSQYQLGREPENRGFRLASQPSSKLTRKPRQYGL
ncbi:hypothetical protein F7D09_0284 [Bifidobacterium leontopitheci]|uniref:Uncharacterized protein n=2 Tax=Bifidobacterium leontopitheci TaxID=2650774 RepID=A0A6I1GSF2_9BIFI|nr:hypothetical protein F7D09_0284 [Bifidobacterium leontopitheci]